MISIIILTVDDNRLALLTDNIRKTIGVEFEIVAIDNRNSKYNIFQAYNLGAEKSKFQYLCFVHEDIFFCTGNWGHELIETFENREIGCIGSVGATVYPKVPTRWSHVPEKYYRSSFIQVDKKGNEKKYVQKDKEDHHLSEVVMIDGCFIVTKKEIWENNRFDESNFDDFHFYDRDFCMQVNRNYKIVINHNFLIKHFSLGNITYNWAVTSRKFFRKWHEDLPVFTGTKSKQEKRQIEYEAIFRYLLSCCNVGYKNIFTFRFILRCFALNPLDNRNLSLIKRFFI